MASLLYRKFQLFHRKFSLMEKLQNETAMYTRLVYIDTVGHDSDQADLRIFDFFTHQSSISQKSF
jgi:hypothetical protein